jgi:hypothetical protein
MTPIPWPYRNAAWRNAAILACFLSAPLSAADAPVDLLRMPDTKLDRHSMSVEASQWAALTDGKEATVLKFAAPSDGIEVVYRCNGLVAAEKVSVRVPAGGVPLRMELLASTVSSNGGFSMLRSELLKPKSGAQQFTFSPTAARWLLLRFTPQRAGADISVAEVEVWGYTGPPVTRGGPV